MQITYQKRDGSVIQRLRHTALPYKIGEETSMGWKVLNIEYEYKNKFYPEYKYDEMLLKAKKAVIRKRQNIEIFKREFRAFIYCLVAMFIINFLKIILGI